MTVEAWINCKAQYYGQVCWNFDRRFYTTKEEAMRDKGVFRDLAHRWDMLSKWNQLNAFMSQVGYSNQRT